MLKAVNFKSEKNEPINSETKVFLFKLPEIASMLTVIGFLTLNINVLYAGLLQTEFIKLSENSD